MAYPMIDFTWVVAIPAGIGLFAVLMILREVVGWLRERRRKRSGGAAP